MITTKCIKISNENLDTIKSDIKKHLKVNEIQTYFPILSLFFDFYNDSPTNFVLNSNFLVKSLIEPIEHKKNDSYIKFFFKANILNQSNNESFNKNIFVKILPILNVSQSMTNDYKLDHNSSLPNIFSSLTSKKLNNYNNSAYIDSFFSYLGSVLTEKGKCPTFPLFFGTFTGVADEFMYDITEEYSSIKRTSWFKKYNNKLFTLNNVDLDNEDKIELNSNSTNSLKTNHSDTSTNLSELVVDESIELDEEEPVDNIVEEPNIEEEDSDNIVEEEDSDIEILEENGYMSGDSLDLNDIRMCNYDTISIDSSSNLSLSSSDMYEINYCCFKNYPVQLNCIEMLKYTLDNYIDKTNNNIPEVEWKSILFQTCFGLSVAQKHYDFVHNDLHSSNIMFKETKLDYLYFNFKGTYFKIPTFGKISKIIDFGRATFNYKKHVFFSDVFRKHGEAEGQYSYPYYNNLDKCKIKPNKSFDLSRLATTIIEHFETDSDIYKLLKLWCMDKYGNFLMDLEDDFNLYRIIAKNVKSAIPKNQINKLIFKEFIVEKDSISEVDYIYNY